MSDSSSKTSEWSGSEWSSNASGEISTMVVRRRLQRSRQAVVRRASISVVAVLLGVSIAWYVNSTGSAVPEYHYAGISCSEVRTHLVAFRKDRKNLEPNLANQIASHLEQCSHCPKLGVISQMPFHGAALAMRENHCPRCKRASSFATSVLASAPIQY